MGVSQVRTPVENRPYQDANHFRMKFDPISFRTASAGRLPACRMACGMLLLLAVSACTPTVKVASPNEPITINLNVKIEHEIKVKVEKDLEQVFSDDSDLF
jgi:hypothetical protein